MISSGWIDPSEERAQDARPNAERPRRVAIVTGTRAEFGLLKPVMEAVRDRSDLELLVIAAGSHLVQPALTFREVKRAFAVTDSVPMQVAGRTGRAADVEALGKDIARFGRSFEGLRPDWVVVLGDRIEAFAAASAASVGGYAVAHIHGGDRAEGVSDEAMRHAITKLSHLHLAASETSGERIRRMGEREDMVFVVGSPAIDGLAHVEAMDDESFAALGSPAAVLLLHPIGRTNEQEELTAAAAIEGTLAGVDGAGVLALHPNFDPGRDGIMRALLQAPSGMRVERHLARERFISLLTRRGLSGGGLAGNCAAGRIEAGARGCPSVDIGPRQGGRERSDGATVWVPDRAPDQPEAIARAVRTARGLGPVGGAHPFGDGRAGVRIAGLLARLDPHSEGLIRKRCTY